MARTCFSCGEPDCAGPDELCIDCADLFCSECSRVSTRPLHTTRESLDEALPCGKCDECCRCYDEEPQTLGDA